MTPESLSHTYDLVQAAAIACDKTTDALAEFIPTNFPAFRDADDMAAMRKLMQDTANANLLAAQWLQTGCAGCVHIDLDHASGRYPARCKVAGCPCTAYRHLWDTPVPLQL